MPDFGPGTPRLPETITLKDALVLSNEYKGTPSGKEAITLAIRAVLDEFAARGYPGCWGICDAQNMPMRKYLLKLGFEEVDIVDFIDKSVVLYEKPFKEFIKV